nr:MAG: nonstructural protein [Microvirus sp.]
MSKLNVFTVRDDKANAFLSPFFMPTIAVAIRSFGAECRNSDSNFSKFPEDFSLYHIGEYDEESGTITPIIPVFLSRASEHVSGGQA